ncbi:cyclic nucleotide-binding domain-containing protein 2-like [Anopheles bellator]|uniref:cyclic nucleotide-binding domain-containing protein 2-like n=1 Tax=Anopheles bellator TaxID=139047 RepID=UPI002647CCF7|nr:cyclic nucleotide-binding domain-containing protein 2-like [Anopheles bellator]
MATKRKADEEKLRRRRLARFRFRRLVHVVIFNRHWIAEIEDQDIGNNVHRNVAIIERRLTRKGTLTIIDKRILNSRPEERTEDHRRTLRTVLRKLECMRDFSKHQLDELAGCVAFQYLEPGRVILREGHEPVSVYFVADGEVTVSRRQWDWVSRAFLDVPCGTRTRGQMFGEITLLQQGIRRTATCTTATACELLWIGRREFERILKGTLLERWRQLQLALERFDYFQYWTTDQFYEYCILSRIVSFEPQQKIPVDVDRSNAYFVLSGQCMILQCLTVARTVAGSYRLLPLQGTVGVEHRFIDVGTLSCGAVFGLGEPLEHRMVVARTAVQCLTVPRNWLLAKRQNVGNTWERLRMRLEAAIPSRRQLFEQFVRGQRWRRYRKQLVDAFVRRNPRNDPAITRPTDVPIICRVEQGDIDG